MTQSSTRWPRRAAPCRAVVLGALLVLAGPHAPAAARAADPTDMCQEASLGSLLVPLDEDGWVAPALERPAGLRVECRRVDADDREDAVWLLRGAGSGGVVWGGVALSGTDSAEPRLAALVQVQARVSAGLRRKRLGFSWRSSARRVVFQPVTVGRDPGDVDLGRPQTLRQRRTPLTTVLFSARPQD